MGIYQSNCKMIGLTLPSREWSFFQAVPECLYSNFFGSCKFNFNSGVIGKMYL